MVKPELKNENIVTNAKKENILENDDEILNKLKNEELLTNEDDMNNEPKKTDDKEKEKEKEISNKKNLSEKPRLKFPFYKSKSVPNIPNKFIDANILREYPKFSHKRFNTHPFYNVNDDVHYDTADISHNPQTESYNQQINPNNLMNIFITDNNNNNIGLNDENSKDIINIVNENTNSKTFLGKKTNNNIIKFKTIKIITTKNSLNTDNYGKLNSQKNMKNNSFEKEIKFTKKYEK